ncbi:MAG: glutathione S-transferase family protein [Parvibaculaceae bacterium]|nr:glutathione S-transferase family protein [Parvibaculaceae bacterium]
MAPPASLVHFYGCPPSMFAGKIRSFLRKNAIAYVERLPADGHYQSVVIPVLGRIWLPVIEMPDGRIVQDTTEIIDFLEAEYGCESCYPQTPRQRIIALMMEFFGDEGLLRTVMHYRWNFLDRQGDFIRGEFGSFMAPGTPREDQFRLAEIPMSQMSAYLPALGITPETIPQIEDSYRELLAAMDAHLHQMPYLLGGRPSIGDYGMIAAFHAHLGRDPVPSFQMKCTASRVARWVERMSAADSDMPEFAAMPAAFLDQDAIPETLEPVLRLMATDHLPVILSTVDAVNRWLEANPVEEGAPIVPKGTRKALASHAPEIRGVAARQGVRHYQIWMLQRIQDAWDALPAADRDAVDVLLERTGLRPLLTARCTRRIERRDYVEVWGRAN